MPLADRAAVAKALADVFRLEKQSDDLRLEIASTPQDVALDAIASAMASAGTKNDALQILEMSTLAGILAHMRGGRVVDLLIDILGSEAPEVRHAAGTALEELAFERWKDVALGVERALSRLPDGSPALRELPYVLIEVPEPGVAKLLQKFFAHPDAEVVAAGIEASVEIGDPAALKAISPLESDPRTVEVEGDGDDTPALVTIGELAREARALLAAGPAAEEGRDP